MNLLSFSAFERVILSVHSFGAVWETMSRFILMHLCDAILESCLFLSACKYPGSFRLPSGLNSTIEFDLQEDYLNVVVSI